MLARKLKRITYDLIACSFSELIPVNKWFVYGEEKVTPIIIRDSDLVTVSTTIEVPMNGYNYIWFFKIITNGNALLRIDGLDYAGIDDYHTYYIIEPGRHKVELLMDRLRLFGDHEPYHVLYASYLVRIHKSLFEAGIKALGIIEVFEKQGYKNQELMEKLLELLELGQTPTHYQMALTVLLLWLGPPYMINKRTDIPAPPSDYILATGLYGSEILAGKHMVFPKDQKLLSRAPKISEELDKLIGELVEKKLKHKIYIVGHSHIDAAWMWSYKDTRRKIRRTFSTILYLIKKEGIIYAQPSSLYIDWLKEESPQLYNHVKEEVRKKKWIPIGGMLIEPDLWMISGEALARHLLYGQNSFMKHFGKKSTIEWLIDSFGYPSSLPQILLKAGIKLLVIHKTAWNILNKPNRHAFIWRGVDGSEIPVFIIPTRYAEVLTPLHILEYDKKSIAPENIPLVMPYGYSDGGGGPTLEMAIYRRTMTRYTGKVADLDEEKLVKEYYENKDKLSIQTGDLLLEIHKGTLTTNHRIKDLVQKAEMTIRSLEVLGALTDKGVNADRLWRRMLLHTFHDVLPGTSIQRTYKEAYIDLENIIKEAQRLMNTLLHSPGAYITIYNDLPWNRDGIVVFNKCLIEKELCKPIGWGEYIVKTPVVPGIGLTTIDKSSIIITGKSYVEESRDVYILANEKLRVVLSNTGEMISIRNREGHEYLEGPSNVITLHIDRPPVSDAWELDQTTLTNGVPFKPAGDPRVLANNGLAACVEFSKKSENIVFRERICLFSGEEIIRVDIDIINNQHLRYIKTWFNTSIYTDKAWFQIPFGAVQRPTMPKDLKEQVLLYEVPALYWMDLSTDEKGLAVISFQKHGYTVLGNKVGLTLLKSPLIPNPYNDIGRHRITYYIYPHKGNTWQADIPAKTAELWTPLKIFKTSKEYNETLLTIKPEKKILVPGIRNTKNKIIIRLYNPRPYKVKTEMITRLKILNETNLLEEPIKSIDNNFVMNKFEVKTIQATK